MKATETVIRTLEPKQDTEETVGQLQYQDLVILMAELEAEGFFVDLYREDTSDRDRLLSENEGTVGQAQYEGLITLLAELEAEGFFKELDAIAFSKNKAPSGLKQQVAKLIQPVTALRAKTIACFDSQTTLTAKVSCTLSWT